MKATLWKLLGMAVIFGLATPEVYADDWVVSFGYSVIPDETINGQRYRTSGNVNLWFGAPEAINYRQGFYINAALPEEVWNSGNGRESSSYTLVNAGFTFIPSDAFILYAGPGLSYQRVNPRAPLETFHRYRLNANLGAIIKIGSFGINLSYDTAPKAVAVGVLLRSSAFQ
ncbi:hypothetical protein CWE09_08505 [Aliidiomarina minuta]|uniref:Outer membrane protein beta-barrel domain-containing protein n=1 Tax=Aliidiomarina minuta TaxID=880057 RepID=A0A432W9R7_9GAMM|nr:hypothetical protein [Aliidiomarina minuta]RUO26726.1 hypothetical protein CWE09_08505 [Aliidiomarina minuta]